MYLEKNNGINALHDSRKFSRNKTQVFKKRHTDVWENLIQNNPYPDKWTKLMDVKNEEKKSSVSSKKY